MCSPLNNIDLCDPHRYLDTVMAFVWDSVVFHSDSDSSSIGGAILIISGCLMSLFARSITTILPSCRFLAVNVCRDHPSDSVIDEYNTGQVEEEEKSSPA